MRAVVVYESMYGNTHLVADAIGNGLRTAYQVDVVPVDRADQRLLERADLVVVGGPTHAHGMSHASTREAAVADAHQPDSDLILDPDAEGPGLREWFSALPTMHAKAAVFDTRVDLPAVLTGRASKGIGRRLRQHGLDLVVEPEASWSPDRTTSNRMRRPRSDNGAGSWPGSLPQTALSPTVAPEMAPARAAPRGAPPSPPSPLWP